MGAGRGQAGYCDRENLGEQQLKNIARPVHVYLIVTGASARAQSVDVAHAAPRLSVVVLPLANLSGNASEDYFADAVTEDITTDLSRIPESFVIARNTAFTYKGKLVDARAVGREFDVRYVLEGSVRRAGNRVRANVQLIDAESGAHLWAERFDCDRADLMDVQDEIVGRIAGALGGLSSSTPRVVVRSRSMRAIPTRSISRCAAGRHYTERRRAMGLLRPAGFSSARSRSIKTPADALIGLAYTYARGVKFGFQQHDRGRSGAGGRAGDEGARACTRACTDALGAGASAPLSPATRRGGRGVRAGGLRSIAISLRPMAHLAMS